MESLRVGAVVESKMGRDRGRYYVVVKEEGEDFVLLSDGDYRKQTNPKLKKVKHLRYRGEYLDDIGAKLIQSVEVTDAEIRRALKVHNTKNLEV